MAINPNTDFTAGAILTADQQNRFPRGIMARDTKATNTGLTTTIGDVGLSVTFTAVANRFYRYTFYSNAANATSSGTLECYITDSANNNIESLNLYLVAGSNYSYIHLPAVRTESAGSTTRKVRAKVGAGTGTMYSTMFFVVEDIGPA
jgi:hypothetical protein